MATALGNCATPVNDILTVGCVASHTSKGISEDFPKEVQAVIVREALEKEILKELSKLKVEGKQVFKAIEFTEYVKALSNAVFLEGASRHTDNKVKILFPEGTKPQTLPSKTVNVEFAFKQVKDELAVAFAELCCKTNDDATKTLVQDSQQRYTFDENKLNTIVEKYYANVLGVISPNNKAINKAINSYEEAINEILKKSELINLTHIPEVLSVLDIKEQSAALRNELTGVSTDEIDGVYNGFLEQQSELIKGIEQ